MSLISRIIYRVKQFIAAFTNHLNYSEVTFIQNYLTKQEQILFFSLNIVDQKHSLTVSYKCMEKINDNKTNIKLVVRAALLHDIGKANEFISIWTRVWYVLLNRKPLKSLLSIFAKENSRIQFRRGFNAIKNHAKRGAGLLRSINSHPIVIEVCEHHHSLPFSNEPDILPLIRKFDNNS